MADENSKPKCKYGENCYQKNEAHLNRFSHPQETDTSNNTDDTNNHTATEKRGKFLFL